MLPATKGGYDFYEVFTNNYINILKKCYKKKQITYLVLYLEKAKLFIRYLIPWTITFQNKYSNFSFSNNKSYSIIWNQYKFHPIFYIGLVYYFFKKINNILQFYFLK
jgi:hypothetical protein